MATPHKKTGAHIKRFRASLELSQAEFAAKLGISVRTLQQWEQGINRPTGTGFALLSVAEANPSVFRKKRQ